MAYILRPDARIEVDELTMAYIECALWSSTYMAPEDWEEPEGYDGPREGDSLDDWYSAEDIEPRTLSEMIKDCANFQEAEAADLKGLDPAQAGHDFWLTRNGHGAGFWDRGLGEVGERLTAASRVYGGVDLSAWDGKVWSN